MKQPILAARLQHITGKARSNGVGKSIRQIAESAPHEISLSTLKAIDAGKHVRPEQLKRIRGLFEMRPLDWIEAKICYAEAYMGAYLVPPIAQQTDENPVTRLDPRLLGDFFILRNKRIQDFQPQTSHQARLQVEVRKALREANTTAATICANVGPPRSKKDTSRMSYPTVTKVQRGEHIRPEKLQAICRHLCLPRVRLIALKVSYVEAFLDEYLLGEDAGVWKNAKSFVDYPRTESLLIFSTEHAKELA